MLEHIDLLDGRRVEREDAVHADAVRGLPDRDGRRYSPAVFASDHEAFERLDAFLLSLFDLLGDANNIARPDGGKFLEVSDNECIEDIHERSYSISGIAAQSAEVPQNAIEVFGESRFEMPSASGREAECQ